MAESVLSTSAQVDRAILSEELGVEIRQRLQTSPKTAILDPLVAETAKDRENDRDLKTLYAHGFIWIISLQLALMGIVILGVGSGLLNYSESLLKLYMAGTISEVFAVIYIIIKNLFAKHD